MRLITRLEIKNFRSIASLDLRGIRDLNVVFGRNDSGKSNILRALNLFFNNRTNEGTDFQIDRDYHVSTAKRRRRITIKVTFDAPTRYNSLRSNLGEFWAQRVWSAEQTRPEYRFPKWVHEDSTKLKSATQLLNTIRFHYVPAIKSVHVFEDLLASIYGVLEKDGDFDASLKRFANDVQKRTVDLTSDLRSRLGMDSQLAPPKDLAALFRRLDFVTGSNEFSLLIQRGDGLKVRHIPEILRFVAAHELRRFHIWGFEEPENSLELSNAITEASHFSEHSQRNNVQIVLTSHSPAFYNLQKSHVLRVAVSRGVDPKDASAAPASTVTVLDKATDALPHTEDIGVLVQLARSLRPIQDEMQSMSANAASLRAEVVRLKSKSGTPLLFVEGESDRIILLHAYRLRYKGKPNCDVAAGGGTERMSALAQDGDVLKTVSSDRPIYVVVDNDPAGRQLASLGNKADSTGSWRSMRNGTNWMHIGVRPKFAELMKLAKVPYESWKSTIERVIDPEIIAKARAEGSYRDGPPDAHFATPKLWKFADPASQSVADPRSDVYSLEPSLKVTFAEWIVSNVKTFAPFEALSPVLEAIHGLRPLAGAEEE